MARKENQEKAVGKYDINKYEGKREQRYFYKRQRPNQEEVTFQMPVSVHMADDDPMIEKRTKLCLS